MSSLPTRATARLLGALLFLPLLACGGTGKPQRVVIPQGATLRTAIDSLSRHGIVRAPALFRVYATVRGGDRKIRPGTYLLPRSASWGEVLAALKGGKGLVRTTTIPEGWSLSQIVPQLARSLGVPVESVTAAVRDTALLHRLDVPTRTLEGYLFPDTYTFPEGASARTAVALMVRRFEQAWEPAWTARLDSSTLSRHDVLTLASLVEKEARLPEERPVIAAVYLNRLRDGMLLQADPTVQYARGEHTARVLYKDLEIDSPYNTYRNKGLPPGPIASPGKPSIRAALYPANVPFKFFVAYPDGHHEFRESFGQHTVAKRGARQAWDSLAAGRRNASAVPPRRPRGAQR